MTSLTDNSISNCNVDEQLKRSRVPTTIPMRYNLVSPYPTYTQYELDMRRKAEILQYKASNQNTKQNGFTKKQAFSQLVNNVTLTSSKNSTYNRKVCDNFMTPTPTSSCNVPGPVEYLYLDESVPLYNYIADRKYDIILEEDTREWNVDAYKDIECSSSNDKTILSLYIRQGILNTYTTYSLSAPIVITLNGVNNTNTEYDLDFTREIVNINVTQVVFQIHYNSNVIKTITLENPTSIGRLDLDTRNSKQTEFSASIYIGNVVIDDIRLYTPPNIIYDFNILTTIELSIPNIDYDESSYYSYINYSAIFNPTNTQSSYTNCNAYSNTTSTPSFYFTGK